MTAKSSGRTPSSSAKSQKDADTLALEKSLTDHLGLVVSVDLKGDGEKGDMRIRFKSLEQLDGLIALLKN